MGDNDHRHISRDSMFVQASLRDSGGAEHIVRIRNLSAGGVMAEGNLRMQRGDAITIEIRNVGWIDGNVAWVADTRFGIAFCETIDPRAVRSPLVSTGPKSVNPHDLLLHRPMAVRLNAGDPRQPVVRKI